MDSENTQSPMREYKCHKLIILPCLTDIDNSQIDLFGRKVSLKSD